VGLDAHFVGALIQRPGEGSLNHGIRLLVFVLLGQGQPLLGELMLVDWKALRPFGEAERWMEQQGIGRWPLIPPSGAVDRG
jgi:hypothetical protein